MGHPNKPVRVVIKRSTGQVVADLPGTLDAHGRAQFTVPLTDGQYTATITETDTGSTSSRSFDIGAGVAIKAPPLVDVSGTTVTVHGTGSANENVRLVITDADGNVKLDQTGTLGPGGTGSYTVTLPSGDYTATITNTDTGAQSQCDFTVP